MINGGCILLSRNILFSDIWNKKPEYLKVWLYLLINVNHTKNKLFDRGENFFNSSVIAKECGISVDSVANCIKWLKSAEQITAQKTARGIVVKVLKYNEYQNMKNYEYGAQDGANYGATTELLRNGYGTINKNDKNERMKEETLVAKATTKKSQMKELQESTEANDERFKQYVRSLAEKKGMSTDQVSDEIQKFINYWTQKNPTGRKELWEMQKVFDLPKRINTWFGNIKKPPGNERPTFCII